MIDTYRGTRNLDIAVYGMSLIESEGISERNGPPTPKRRTKKNQRVWKSGIEITPEKWALMDRVAEYLKENGPVASSVIHSLFKKNPQSFIKTMTVYYPIYSEDFTDGQAEVIGYNTDPEMEKRYAEMRRKAKEARV